MRLLHDSHCCMNKYCCYYSRRGRWHCCFMLLEASLILLRCCCKIEHITKLLYCMIHICHYCKALRPLGRWHCCITLLFVDKYVFAVWLCCLILVLLFGHTYCFKLIRTIVLLLDLDIICCVLVIFLARLPHSFVVSLTLAGPQRDGCRGLLPGKLQIDAGHGHKSGVKLRLVRLEGKTTNPPRSCSTYIWARFPNGSVNTATNVTSGWKRAPYIKCSNAVLYNGSRR